MPSAGQGFDTSRIPTYRFAWLAPRISIPRSGGTFKRKVFICLHLAATGKRALSLAELTGRAESVDRAEVPLRKVHRHLNSYEILRTGRVPGDESGTYPHIVDVTGSLRL